ncbi:hypothetical protein MTR_5g054870 [Medicago truncatula]|uniref:Uncharacterized protein n=1 Tax=Medicago truncatula TaxID=3880 RepID=G7JZC1_MEDTR|nr:hypothetical protein MTR_5g054870 [Medicago truncatula]
MKETSSGEEIEMVIEQCVTGKAVYNTPNGGIPSRILRMRELLAQGQVFKNGSFHPMLGG